MTALTQDAFPSPSDAALTNAREPSRTARITGIALSSLAVLFLGFDTVIKLFVASPAVAATTELGFSSALVRPLGLIELACLVTYLVPRTRVLGAVLWTGYLGGAIATHVRLENPLFSHTLFPIYVAALLWGGLLLRSPQLRDFFFESSPSER